MSELPLVAALAGIVLMFFTDLFWILLAYSANNTVCSEVARYVSQGAPDQFVKGEPRRRAFEMMNRLATANGVMQFSKSIEMNEKLSKPFPDATFGGPVNGDIEISTQICVHPPCFLSRLFGEEGLKLSATKTFPFTWVMKPERNPLQQAYQAGTNNYLYEPSSLTRNY